MFVVEQNCPYLDLDDKRPKSFHVLGYDNDKLVACTRLVPVGISYNLEPSIGRVVTHPSVRSLGYGKSLMEYSIAETKKDLIVLLLLLALNVIWIVLSKLRFLYLKGNVFGG